MVVIFAFSKLANLIETDICHAIVILLKGFSVEHISSLLFGSVDFQTIFPSSSGASNIKLAMGKWLILQVKSNLLQRLSLAFVDAHGIAWFYWELESRGEYLSLFPKTS